MMTFNETATQKIFFTSDWHYNHSKTFVYESRGYSTIQEYNEGLVNTVNSIVSSDDILFNLGDLTLNSTTEDFEKLISNIKCKNIYLLFGNHPNKHYKNVYIPMVKEILGSKYIDGMEIYPLRYKNVIYLGHYAEITVNHQYVVLSHYPISIWNHIKHGAWMLCGHSHYGYPTSTAENLEGKILDVGWDGLGKPWSLDEVKSVMDKKKIVQVDEHH